MTLLWNVVCNQCLWTVMAGHEIPVTTWQDSPSWCQYSIALPYAAIQSQYWNVGFFKYYEFKQIPNFILALPMVMLCASGIVDYCHRRWNYVCVLGLLETQSVQLEQRKVPLQGVYSNKSLVYIVHLAVLLVIGVTCMHVQVCVYIQQSFVLFLPAVLLCSNF